MGAVLEKQWLFCAQIFLGQNHLVFVYMKYFFVLHQHVFLESKILFVQRQTFYFNTKFHFCFIFLLSHSNKNIITCQKINKLSFLCDTKKIISFCLHHHFFIFSFYITHCQHVDLLRSSPGNKETFNHLLLTFWYIPKQLLSKSFFRKKGFLLSRFNVCKASKRSSYISKLQACLSQILIKLKP